MCPLVIADIASRHFRSMVDEHIFNLTITQEKIQETEKLRGRQNKSNRWFEKRKLLTASNFGETAKTKVEPSNS